MILRLVYSFFFFSLVTGDKQLDDTKKTDRMSLCENKVCFCQDDLVAKSTFLSSPSTSTYHQKVIQGSPILSPQLKFEQRSYGYAPKVSSGPGRIPAARIDTQNLDMGVVSDNDSPSYQVPAQHERRDFSEKTICFTPRMVHKMVKAALDYVSEIPADISTIVGKLEKELNKMPDTNSFEDLYIKKPLYPLDSRTIFQMLNKPKSEARNNLVLKYDLPSGQEPQCKDALEKLIEIAYKAYLELEQHPQCRDYLYKFASHQPEDRPKGHLDNEPDMKSLVSSILEQVDKQRPKPQTNYDGPEYKFNTPEIDVPMPEIPIPQIQEIREVHVPQIPEYNIPKLHEMNIPDMNMPQIHEMNDPQIHEINDPQIHEMNDPQSHEMNDPQIHDMNDPQIHEMNDPQIHEMNDPQIPEYNNMPQIHEYDNMPQIHEIEIPQIHDIPKIHKYNIPKMYEYNIPQIPDIQKVQPIEIPNFPGNIQEAMPMQPEETYDFLVDLLKNNDKTDNSGSLNRFRKVVADNQHNFDPKAYNILTTLLNKQKQQNIPRLEDILLFILDSDRKKQWPWSDSITDLILSLLLPDRYGNIDPRIVDTILDLYNKPTNEKQIEYILSLLRPIKEGKIDPGIADIVNKLIKSNINNLLLPEHIEVLLKLLKPTRSGNDPEKVNIVDNLTRWNKLGITPNQLDALVTLLKPDSRGNTDPRLIDIINFLLKQNKYLSPKHLDFILSFLYPENGVVDSRRIDVIHFLLNSALHPKHINRLLQLLEENPLRVLNSKFLDILMLLNDKRLLSPELAETVIQLLNNDLTGQLDNNQIKSLFFQLAPIRETNPKVIVDVLNLLNQDGQYGDLVKWIQSPNNNIGIPNHDATPPTKHVLPSKVQNLKLIDYSPIDQFKWKDHDPTDKFKAIDKFKGINHGPIEDHEYHDQYRTPDDGYQTDDDFMTILKWLDTQGLLNADQGSNADLVNNILKILDMGESELGVVELTYMLKHEKPLIYQPVYYVKYRLPILSFIANMKNILLENPQLTADPMKLLQELIVVSNVTEVSPNLQGYPKEEILKLTVNDGDLVQAKILDEQNLNLNEQINHVHELNSDISPEELLQQNKINEAKYYPDVLQFRGEYPEKVTMHENKLMKFPTVHYHQIQVKQPVLNQPVLKAHTHLLNGKKISPQHRNALLRYSK